MKTTIKKTLMLIALLSAMLVPNIATAQTDSGTLGLKLGYATKNDGMAAGLFYQYRVNKMLRISPEMGFIIRNDNLDAFTADLNFHFPLNLANSNINLYPLVGINYSAWTHHIADAKSHTVGKFGFNLGAGFEYLTASRLKLRLEIRHTFTNEKFSNSVADFGVGYMF